MQGHTNNINDPCAKSCVLDVVKNINKYQNISSNVKN